MHVKTSTNDTDAAKALAAQTRLMLPPGGVVEGSLSAVKRALRRGATPAFVFVFEPSMTPLLKAQMDRWVSDPDLTFNTMVVVPEGTTFLKAQRFSGR